MSCARFYSPRGRFLTDVLGAPAVWLGLGLFGSSCGGAPPQFSELQPLINTACAFSSCHGSSRQGMLSLQPSDAYCALVGSTTGATFRDTARSAYPRRVVPMNRDASFVYKKLTLSAGESGPNKPLGDVMPDNQPFTDLSNIDLFGRWIDGGAKDENGLVAPGSCP